MRTPFMPMAIGAVIAAGVTLLIIGPPGDRASRAPMPVLLAAPPPAPSAAPAPAMAASVPKPVAAAPSPWPVPDIDRLPDDDWGRAVRLGRELIVRTYALIGPEVSDPAHRYAGNNLSCQSCHLQAGTKRFGLPFQGVYATFPNYRARTGAVGTIEDRINGCMARSMNGRPLPLDSPEMHAMAAYLKFLSVALPSGTLPPGRGAGAMPELSRAADPDHGKAVFARLCAACHGPDGQGRRVGHVGDAKGYIFPPLWGPDSFNDGAGMDRLIGAANFVHDNMPNGTSWHAPAVSVEEAWDVAAYIQAQPRPHKANLDRDFPHRLQKPVDSGYGPYADGFSQDQHKLGPFPPIRAAITNLSAAEKPPPSAQP